MNNKRWKQFLSESKKPKVKKLFQKAKQIPYKFDWGLLGEQKRTPEIATFDFDDTLYATDTKSATPMVQAAKDLAASGNNMNHNLKKRSLGPSASCPF